MAVYSTRLSSTLVVRSARSKSSLPLAVIQSAALFLKRRPAEGCEMATWAGNCWPNRSGPCGEEKASTQESVAEAMQRTRRKLLHPISKDHAPSKPTLLAVIPLSALQPRSEQERDLRWGGVSHAQNRVQTWAGGRSRRPVATFGATRYVPGVFARPFRAFTAPR